MADAPSQPPLFSHKPKIRPVVSILLLLTPIMLVVAIIQEEVVWWAGLLFVAVAELFFGFFALIFWLIQRRANRFLLIEISAAGLLTAPVTTAAPIPLRDVATLRYVDRGLGYRIVLTMRDGKKKYFAFSGRIPAEKFAQFTAAVQQFGVTME